MTRGFVNVNFTNVDIKLIYPVPGIPSSFIFLLIYPPIEFVLSIL